jgi:hypothetical protein
MNKSLMVKFIANLDNVNRVVTPIPSLSALPNEQIIDGKVYC